MTRKHKVNWNFILPVATRREADRLASCLRLEKHEYAYGNKHPFFHGVRLPSQKLYFFTDSKDFSIYEIENRLGVELEFKQYSTILATGSELTLYGWTPKVAK